MDSRCADKSITPHAAVPSLIEANDDDDDDDIMMMMMMMMI